MNFIDKIIAIKKEEITEINAKDIFQRLENMSVVESSKKEFLPDQFNIIAEIKRSSPSKGHLAKINDPIALAHQYAQGGVQAISVLTEKKYFNGLLEDLKQVSGSLADTNIAVLRKDFIIDELQIYQAAAFGASAVLLITSMVKDQLAHLIKVALEVGLQPFVETHSLDDIKCAEDAGAKILGINNRNLHTLEVDPEHCLRMIDHVTMSTDIKVVAESGIHSIEQVQAMKKSGFTATLIGEFLVKSNDPAALIQTMLKD
ncbi:Indole-3-glycerol phosphate synthase [Piscirickettsia salmonis]|uniref:indole-3-glycerol-phosphate synthase n=1 Tax=Piscirickettsia salmonis TaxID=1238 RepID=A0A1L6TFF8_PISSA|nr:indole-3-glycerol phosphate synthase TrpC [Piscirickettsia salmonis]AKP72315.1 indole-3-glycerol phosphate synthase [Piscirickettsia salmonis LF-89 = ATCC VR-1361]ALB24240.1 indole-3-glycerol phosphate synthase family protein [Piscirickettsia salmonis]ALY04034.1 indole-3-glycerol phosphate synthase [Piscirickettsia salmonis]AMA43598.1 indole-3-glycerol phosphate synthase [Piscirickettsia salmonis]AOS36067.1 indole-3-glycerol phosphate synthase [Piscirickettsia salmonis]